MSDFDLKKFFFRYFLLATYSNFLGAQLMRKKYKFTYFMITSKNILIPIAFLQQSPKSTLTLPADICPSIFYIMSASLNDAAADARPA